MKYPLVSKLFCKSLIDSFLGRIFRTGVNDGGQRQIDRGDFVARPIETIAKPSVWDGVRQEDTLAVAVANESFGLREPALSAAGASD